MKATRHELPRPRVNHYLLVSAILLGCGGSGAEPGGGADSTTSSGPRGDATAESAATGTGADASVDGPLGTPDATSTGDAGGTPLDGSVAEDLPFAPPPTQVCEAVWMQPDAGSGGVGLTNPPGFQLAVDAMNDIYLAVTYQDGQLAVGDAGPTASGQGVVLAKLDADCNQLWVRTLGSVANSSVMNEGIGVDSDSNVTIGGWFQGAVDFGDGVVFDGDVDGAPVPLKGYLVRYDASGTLVFRNLLLLSAASRDVLYGGFAGIVDLTVAPDGVSTVLAPALGDVDFGIPAPDAGDAEDTEDYDAGTTCCPARRVLVQFDAQGRVLGIPPAAQQDFQQIAADMSGTLWGWANLAPDGGGLPAGPEAGVGAPFLVHLSPSAEPLWVQPLPLGLSSFAVGTPGAVVLAYPGSQDPVPSHAVQLQAFSSDGGSPWNRVTPLPASSSLLGGAPMAVAPDGTIFVGGTGVDTASSGQDGAITTP